MKKAVLFILSFTASLFPSAQPQLRFQNFDTRDGLSHYLVNCLFIDSRGFLWIGTEFGLNRFDGVTFEKWFHISGDTASLLNNKIISITEDQHEQLWLATEKGISIYLLKTGRFHSFTGIHTKNGGTVTPEQPNTFCDREGDIWIGNAGGSVILYKSKTNEFFNIPLQLSPAGRIQNKYVAGFLQDRKGRIWVTTSYGIYQLDKERLSSAAYRFDEKWKYESSLNTSITLFETKAGYILSGTWNAGFLIYDEKENRFKAIHGEDGPFLPSSSIFHFAQQDSIIFFATLSGLFARKETDLMDSGFTDFDAYKNDRNDPNTVAFNSISCLLSDALGNVWIGGIRDYRN